ncbi:tRNA pseudouridine(38-40) synthase TruA [Periweissella beninensis]|uniref:tRNA pseudouridine synthase A n=1 Tax=Periweissella beninensis TaxID=504936 RepID=A0ABT0VMU7_9LACO|nr:tRNA pseudouridine(38-40) synthase TruA [Periweissella beninensis]MBM7544362.1 tRNA pseudouridine38-40 synthase [Periweissella beninensis]MCM2437737.1 tRNA pseudouridine(38-40) synthase TruA [Periweissella beninensis]MCT4395945.1 tRNA pseudouridine(38-40) synthase TruA [Periweissella beninensis]
MQRYKVTISYDGTDFAGFQRQPKQRTVESVLTLAVNKMAKNPTPALKVHGSGRTDSGVHAYGQVVHFDLPFDIPAQGVRRGLNALLPLDIVVTEVEQVTADFHARFSNVGKEYVYKISRSDFVDPFKRRYMYNFKYALDLELIREAMPDLVGIHDFSSFVASGTQATNFVREIFDVQLIEHATTNEIEFVFQGKGFLYNQVRIMTAVLLEIGTKKRPVHDILRLYTVKDRQAAPLTAPAHGLYLAKVFY